MLTNRSEKTALALKTLRNLAWFFAGLALLGISASAIRKPLVILRHNGQTLFLEQATTNAERGQGLSNRLSLANNKGMLFVFDKPGKYCFWMKEMRFPLDIIWLNEEKRVVYLQENLSPATFPQNFCPEVPTKYVLEFNAGTAHRLNFIAAH